MLKWCSNICHYVWLEGKKAVCEIRLTDTAVLGAAGRLPMSRKQEETVTGRRICQELDNPTGFFCRVSPYTFDLDLWCISEISLLTLVPAYIVTPIHSAI